MNFGFVNQSHSMATVSGKGSRELGGLAGCNHKVYEKPGGVIDQCSSGGSVSVEDRLAVRCWAVLSGTCRIKG